MKRTLKLVAILLIMMNLVIACTKNDDDNSETNNTGEIIEESGVEFAIVPTDDITPEFQIAVAEISNEQFSNYLNLAFVQNIITYNSSTLKVYNLEEEEVIFLGGSRVVKDHNKDGIYELDEMENPLNRCFIQFNESTQEFEVVDPAKVNWEQYCNPELYPNVVDDINDWYELSGNQNGFYGHGDADGQLPTLDEVKTWPANFVRYYGAKEFAEFYGYDLPSLKQWKLAGKGGNNFEYATADGTVNPSSAWYNTEALAPPFPIHKGHVQPVKSLLPNPLGVYNLGGNVWEWTKDWYRGTEVFSMDKQEEDFYIADEPEDANHLKGLFGGSFNYFSATMGIDWNHAAMPNTGNDHFGFRVVKN